MYDELANILPQLKYVEPRDYQERIIEQVVNGFTKENYKSILVESPTGSGKTIMGMLICKIMEEKKDAKIGWVAHRRFLLSQAENEARNKCIHLKNIEYISMFDKCPPTNLDLLVIDEAVHDAASSCVHLHNVIRPKWILGLSAHPLRTDRVKLCFDKTIKDAGIAKLIKDGYLSEFEHFTITEEWTPKVVAKHYLLNPKKWGKSIVYFHTIAQCFEFQEILAAENVNCEVVTGNSDKIAQLQQLKKDPELNVVVNCMMLTEGFNFKKLGSVFCRPSCRGLTIQMAGRVLRKSASRPTKYVIQNNQTKWPFMKTATPKNQFVWKEEKWAGLKPNENADLAAGKCLNAIATINVELPSALKKLQEKRANRKRIGRITSI